MSLRVAVDAKCKDCIYDAKSGGGTWREQVAQCPVIGCPLWPVRTGPESGPFANPPRNPQKVSREWLELPIGRAILAHPTVDLAGGAP